MHPVRELNCRVAALGYLTHDTKLIRLEILEGGPLAFSAGQYAKLVFPDVAEKYYSIASLPGDTGLEFHIRRTSDGSSSSHFVLDELSVGDAVEVTAPMGKSYFRTKHLGPVLCVAGGSGMAPIRCIVETALRDDPDRELHLYFGARDEPDIYLEDRFLELAEKHRNFTFTPVLSAPSGQTSRRTGFVHEAVAADIPSFEGWKAYLCGPPPMVNAMLELLRERRLAEDDIHADAF